MVEYACVVAGNASGSVSPLIWNYWFDKFKIGVLYDYFTLIVSVQGCPMSVLKARNDFVFFSVASPYKEYVRCYVDESSATVNKLGAVSAIFVRDGRWYASNYDGYGFIQGLKIKNPAFDCNVAKVLILGTGATSRAVILALIGVGVKSIYVVSRSYQKAYSIQKCFNLAGAYTWQDMGSIIPKMDLVFNGTTLPSSEIGVNDSDLLYDPNYHFGVDNSYKDGLWMLILQAKKIFTELFGFDPGCCQELFQFLCCRIEDRKGVSYK